MNILMIGGTGIISAGVSKRLLTQGHTLWLLNRGTRPELTPAGAGQLVGDMSDETAVARLLEGKTFDVVVDWMVYTPEEARRDIRLFSGRTGHYVFISSGSAYQRPSRHYLITEQTPLDNPFSLYARNKAACEAVFLEAWRTGHFPATIVRPSLTYGDICIPYVLNSWHKPWTLIDRMRKGKRVIVPGDGTSLWEITHNEDFALGFTGLLGRRDAMGEAFHITSGEVMTWESILRQIAEAAGVQVDVAHVSSEFICAFMPEETGSLMGDKSALSCMTTARSNALSPTTCRRFPSGKAWPEPLPICPRIRSASWWTRHTTTGWIESWPPMTQAWRWQDNRRRTSRTGRKGSSVQADKPLSHPGGRLPDPRRPQPDPSVQRRPSSSVNTCSHVTPCSTINTIR